MTSRRILITWTGGPFDGNQEYHVQPQTGPADRQALAVQDGVGKITSIAWYRLDQASAEAWQYVFDCAESQKGFRESNAGAQAPLPNSPVMPPHFFSNRQAAAGGE